MPSVDGGRADVILRNEAMSQIVYLPESRYRQQMEKNCTGGCNAVMTKSHDLAEFVRGAQLESSHFPYLYGRFDCGVRSLRNGVGDFRILSFFLTTFTGIGNDENSDSVVCCLFKGISCALLSMPI